MPGSVKSIANSGWPLTIFALSTPWTLVPMILKSFLSFSLTLARSGGVIAAAFVAIAP